MAYIFMIVKWVLALFGTVSSTVCETGALEKLRKSAVFKVFSLVKPKTYSSKTLIKHFYETFRDHLPCSELDISNQAKCV